MWKTVTHTQTLFFWGWQSLPIQDHHLLHHTNSIIILGHKSTSSMMHPLSTQFLDCIWANFTSNMFPYFSRNSSTWGMFNHKIPMTSSVQSLSHVQLFMIPWTTARQASLSITNSWSLLKLISIESVMPSNHPILCRPLSSRPLFLPASGSFPMSQLFSSGGQSFGVSASTSVLPMNTQDWSPLGWTASFTILNFSKAFHKVSCNALTNKINLCELNYDLGSKLFKLLFPRQVINNST